MTLLVYGAYGYTGALVSRAAVDRGTDPILAGRDGDALRELGRDLRCSVREFDLSIPEAVTETVRDVDAVLNCAGPFASTAAPLVDACVETGTDYLDVTGEFRVFEALAARDAEATAADVTLLPGVGFDVVPTDCVAAALLDRLPDATALALGFDADGDVSRGTARTAVRGLGETVVARRGGALVSLPTDERERRIDFGRGERPAAAVPWGDLVTAAHTTGVGDVTVYAALPPRVARLRRLARPVGPLLRTRPVRWLLDRVVAARVEGPTAAERAANRAFVWGEARTDAGEVAVERLRTPDPYDLTVEASLAAAERVLAGDAPSGFTTPAGAFGSSFVDVVDGVTWLDR
ncbi:NAD(P)H-binding protein [Halorubrum sp. JWXQ-INN 858]|uniref:saccharopine dehydrogenase family protein n=1 Tax=Halorubrum sp. JWXQ-INN 858 TaxID=2690782 RepID=UPI0013FC4A49|nr:saccharopine dehydrogenase NADP-binding domain-containing protein [Halorubrum sp. JWXQ-INN 858]MWV65987.1 NAD(P)H-binding protein [Halorubrum sp. JWXQ-INN 858]